MEPYTQVEDKTDNLRDEPQLFASPWIALFVALKNGAQRSAQTKSKAQVKPLQN